MIGRAKILAHGTKIEYAFHQTLFPHAIKRLGMGRGGGGGGGGGAVVVLKFIYHTVNMVTTYSTYFMTMDSSADYSVLKYLYSRCQPKLRNVTTATAPPTARPTFTPKALIVTLVMIFPFSVKLY